MCEEPAHFQDEQVTLLSGSSPVFMQILHLAPGLTFVELMQCL